MDVTGSLNNFGQNTFLLGGGAMAGLIQSFKWSETSIGAIEEWPQSLRTAVNIALQSPVPIVMLWGEDGIMLYNDAYSIFAGARHPSLLGSKVIEGWPEVADFNRNVMKMGLQGKTLSYKNQQLTLYRNNVAEEVWMDLNYSPIMNKSGKPAGVLAIVVETTERILAERKQRQAEQTLLASENALQKSEEHLRALITATSDIIYTMSADWSQMGILQGKVFIPDVEKPRDDWFENNIPPSDQQLVRDAINIAIRDKSVFQLEHRVRLADGSIGWTFSRAIHILGANGEIIEWLGTASDVTERKRGEKELVSKNEQLIKINNDLDNFIYTASHDLKAPMSNIEGLVISLRDHLQMVQAHFDEDIQTLLELMEKSINRFKNTILDLTEISKIQKGMLEDVEEVEFSKVVDDVKLSINDKIKESKATICSDFTKVSKIRFSQKNLKSIIYNLVSNAIKYRNTTHPPEVVLQTEALDGYTVLIIKDNGLGFSEANMVKMFTMFKRFHDHIEGTGIGLYIVKRIIDNAGGKIEVDSTIGKGTTFRIYFKV